jgi:hypothetical protein
VSHNAELAAVIEELSFPSFICVNETLLPGERAMPNIVFGTETLRRSLFGLVRIYNLLPQSVVDFKSVKEFQSILQGALRHAASLGIPNWDSLFSNRLRPVRDLEFQRHFEG